MADETRVGHCKADKTDVYIGRGPKGRAMGEAPIGERGWLGNPYEVEEYGREECIRQFKGTFSLRLVDDVEFREAVAGLSGKRLGCWCQRLDEDKPACHGEVIAEIADKLADPETSHTEVLHPHVV